MAGANTQRGGMAMGRLEGKAAIVLGAAGANNMGQVIAKTFSNEGARVN